MRIPNQSPKSDSIYVIFTKPITLQTVLDNCNRLCIQMLPPSLDDGNSNLFLDEVGLHVVKLERYYGKGRQRGPLSRKKLSTLDLGAPFVSRTTKLGFKDKIPMPEEPAAPDAESSHPEGWRVAETSVE